MRSDVSISSPTIEPLGRSGGREEISTIPHTFVAAIAARDGLLYVQHGRVNYDDDGPAYLLDVFTYDGELIYQGVPTEGRLQGWHEAMLMFVETRATMPHGGAKIVMGRIEPR